MKNIEKNENDKKRLEQVVVSLPLSSGQRRFFMAAEFLCKTTSLLTIVLLIARLLFLDSMFIFPVWFNSLTEILASAAVGFLTNWLAIEMIFKPYDRSSFHYLSILTLGYWKQGLVPKNKNLIAVELGKQIETKLLNPEKIANELCDTAVGLIQNPDIIHRVSLEAQELLRENEEQILDYLYPRLENSIAQFLDKILTPENLEVFFQEKLEPYLQRPAIRQLIAESIQRFSKERSAYIIDLMKEHLRDRVYRFLSRNILTANVARTLSDRLIDYIDWLELDDKIRNRIDGDAVRNFLSDEVLNVLKHIREQIATPAGRENLLGFTEEMRLSLKESLGKYLHDTLPETAKVLIESNELWNRLENNILPKTQPRIENWIRENGQEFVMNRLNISSRVREAVDRQDIRTFHRMINTLVAEHLSAIQVLGFILGAAIGLLQYLKNFF